MRISIAVLGLGHVGLPTALGLAELGWAVVGADANREKVRSLRDGKVPFYEPGVEELLRKHLASGRFTPVENVDAAIRGSQVLFICVGTPQAEDGRADLRPVEALARSIACNLNSYKLIVEKSTVPAITGQWIKKTIERECMSRRHNPDVGSVSASTNGNGDGALPLSSWNENGPSTRIDFEVASNPEFLQEGRALDGFFHPDRIVCGVTSRRGRRIMAKLYNALNCPKLFTDLTTAELIKHASNAYLATKISFINLVGDLCDCIGADVEQVAKGVGLDSRIGTRFLHAGIGFGGYCLPKDLRAFIHLMEEHQVDASLLRHVEAINANRVDRLLCKLTEALWILEGKTVAVLGLAFKAGTDDIRESPSLRVIDALRTKGARLQLYDPQAMEPTALAIGPNPFISFAGDVYAAAKNADAVLILTDWDEFRKLDLDRLRGVMRFPLLVDGRNILDPSEMAKHGFEYLSVGRSTVSPAREQSRRLKSNAHQSRPHEPTADTPNTAPTDVFA